MRRTYQEQDVLQQIKLTDYKYIKITTFKSVTMERN